MTINKLTALAKGNIDNSNGSGVADSVNGLIGLMLQPVNDLTSHDFSSGIINLLAGTYEFTGTLLEWDKSNSGMVGAGIDKTILESIPTADTSSVNFHDILRFTGTCENVLFQDLTFIGTIANAGSGVSSLRNITFNRVRFTTSKDDTLIGLGYVSTNGVKLTTHLIANGISNIYFIDCQFDDCARMGCEIFSGTGTSTVHHSNIYFIRPHCTNNGRLVPGVGQGISIDGYGDNINIIDPYFDGNNGYQLEIIGSSRVSIENIKIRASTLPLGFPPVLFSNTLPMHDYKIDGFNYVGDSEGAATKLSPNVSETLQFNNVKSFTMLNININIGSPLTPTKAMYFGSLCEDVNISDSVFKSDSNDVLIAFTNTLSIHKVSNTRFNSSNDLLQDVIGCFGSGEVKVNDCINTLAYPASSPRLFSATGSGKFKVDDSTLVSYNEGDYNSVTTRFGSITMLAGTSYIQSTHDMFGEPSRITTPEMSISSATRFWSGSNSTIFNITTDSNVLSDTSFIYRLDRVDLK